MIEIRKEADFRSQVAGPLPTVAVFKTTWCKDCHYIEPFMPDVEKKYENRLQFIVVDRDDLAELCSEYNILGIPSFIVFRQGEEITRFVSKLRKTREEIEQFLDRSLQVAEALGA
ncbi:thioredoxin family protein [Gorillibacterium sp. sgz5001074]|uniref:thioredoxin family protein n=1 Tax=Gorillibacterium sp. sgz5001074 TaxID=3446695 RepID=UPI003F66F594